MSQPNRRFRYFVNPRFQLAFMGYAAGLAVAVGAISYGAVYYFFSKLHAFGLAVGLPPNHMFFQFIAEQRAWMDGIFSVALFLIIVVVLVHAFFLSHKIAGPLYKLRLFLIRESEGLPPQEMRFRRGDFFPELQDAYNRRLNGKKPDASDRKVA